jgi:HK97 family phage portal protein
VNRVQKLFARWFAKATGFPSWNAATWPNALLRGYGSHAGADSLAVVYGCSRVRGQIVGSLPVHLYREKKSGTREKDVDNDLYWILYRQPNSLQNAREFRECMERSYCLWGNSYAKIGRLGGRIVSLNFIRPDRMRPRWDIQRQRVYEYTTWDGKLETYGPDDILHVKNFSDDGGLTGVSPLLRYVMEHALSAQTFGLSFLKNGGRPSGYLKHKTGRPASEEAVNKYKNDWQAEYGGPENAGKTPVLWNDSEYVPLSVPPEEAQLLETAKRLTGDIAGAVYGVPLMLLGQPDGTPTFASAEQFGLQFVRYTLGPQTELYESALNSSLLKIDRTRYFKFELGALLKGDKAAQAAFYASALQNAWMTVNEVRRKENLPEVPDGDTLYHQSNLIPLGMLPPPNQPQLPSAGGNL